MDNLELTKRLRVLRPDDLDTLIGAFPSAGAYVSKNSPAKRIVEFIEWAQGAKCVKEVESELARLEREIVHGGGTPADPAVAALRAAYLNSVFESVGHLALAGIDPKAKSDAESRLDLAAVYTALMTLTPAELPGKQADAASDERAMTEPGKRRRSAVEMLDRCKRLVLLGDPGGGKSTFVNFVCLCLAGEALRRKEANLAALTAPLPEDERKRNEKKKPERQPWHHGTLLPVVVVLRDFAARGLPPPGELGNAGQLRAFIEAELKAAALGEYAPHLFRELRADGGLLLLDGLDEVPEADRRREQLKKAVEDFAAAFPKCRLLVTSRTYAYQRQEWRLRDFEETVLAPFDDVQIRLFVERWHLHIAKLRGSNLENAKGNAELLNRTIATNPRLRELAERPLLLALMTSLNAWRGGSLPDKREQLYADTVDLLLDWWETQKVVKNRDGTPAVIQPSFLEWLRTDRERMRGLFNELAFKAHANQRERTGTADIAEEQLVKGLMAVNNNPDVKPGRLTEYLWHRAGLLIPRGVGVYTFPHRSFQEYLAACYLTDHDFPDALAQLARDDPGRWREVTLLAAAKAARGTEAAVRFLADALCPGDLPSAGEQSAPDAWGALLAGQALVESVPPDKLLCGRHGPLLERVKKHLLRVMEAGQLPAVERARAGDALAALGDSRSGVTDVDAMEFCLVPAGPFRMGSPKEDQGGFDVDRPCHEATLTRDYWIGRYPVTVAQYRAFLKATGREPEDAACLAEPPNRPVTRVSWNEALTFCEWLTERRRSQGRLPDGWRITLPTEAQWEKAARGGLRVPRRPVVDAAPKSDVRPELAENPDPLRRYPWTGDFNPEKANSLECEINGTSAVGCFAQGVGPYGAEELSGNVLEWCLDGQRKYTETPQTDPLGSMKKDAGRSLRGGCFWYFARYCRSAFRVADVPGFRDRSLGFRLAAGQPVEPAGG